MPSSPSSSPEHRKITSLLTKVIALLTRELAIIANRQWQELPGLKRAKVILASRLKSVAWPPVPGGEEPASWRLLKSRIATLEAECRKKIEAQFELIRHQIGALQELDQYWRECMSISFRDFHEAIPAA